MIFSYPLFEIPFIGIYLIILAFMFGAVFASFITCTAWRVVRGEDWMLGHSHCDTCGHELSTADLFPIISYIALKGKCRYCGSKVPPRDLIFEIILGLLFAGTLALHGVVDAAVIAALALEMLLLGLSLADWDSGVIPDGFLAAILVVWILTVGFRQDIQRFAIEGVIAFMACGLLMAIATAIIGKIMKAKVSYGPTKLAMCLMLFLGFKGSVVALGVAVVLGIFFALVCKSKKRRISLAPAISIGFVVAFLVKDALAVFFA
ncbi:leader peptidase (prepilin peptidase)/N-methyltransferase [Ruminococcaceae bacterium R-25]|nr:leader peptidase (prepilin peptidase)/N-methyltransferase [Ruminococcaceae bacterium R-25]SUQ10699.1 leader peptidase (prepilin peptidase) / N-methyltransferase [Oscillospiraceae bacterium]